MAEIQSHGLCVMGCGRVGTHRDSMYCEWCYDTWRRGGFDKKPFRVRVKAVRGPTGKIVRKAYTRTQWKSQPQLAAFRSVKEIRAELDNRPRCTHDGCDNLARHNADGTCDGHNEKARKRVLRYRAEGKVKQRNAEQKSKLRQRQAA